MQKIFGHGKKGIFLVGILFFVFFSFVHADLENRSNIQEGTAIDVGLNSSYGVHLDFIEDGATHKVLEIDLGSTRSLSSHDLLFLTNSLDFSALAISSPELVVKRTRNITLHDPQYNCSTTFQNLVNGSLDAQYICSLLSDQTSIVEEVYWETVALETDADESELFTAVASVEGRYFRYSFDVPLLEHENGFGNIGRSYVGVEGDTFVDLQHSSWWNTSFSFRKAIQINNSASETLRKWFTIEVSGLDTLNNSLWNASHGNNGNNFAVVCDGSEVSKLIGASTDLYIDASTKLYPDSTGYKTANTTFLFRLPINISASTINNTLCYVYYGSLSFNSSANNKSQIALFYDDFNRANSAELGNAWSEGVTSNFFQIVSNYMETISDNGRAARNLDVATCYDCEKYELLSRYDRNGALNGSGICVGLDNTSGVYEHDGCYSQGGSKGIATRWSDESFFYRIGTSDSTFTAVKSQTMNMAPTDIFTTRVIGFDDTNRGDYIAYLNNSYILWTTNTTSTSTTHGIKEALHVHGNRANARLDYIMVKRFMDVPPTISLGSQETYSATSSGESAEEAAIESGIRSIIPLAAIYTDQQIYTRYANGTQMLGGFDKIAYYRHQHWAFNFINISAGESFTRMYSMQPALYVWENQSINTTEIQTQVQNWVFATLILSS